ncbi:MAG: aldo/keto reductase [Bacteroidaceae bacterium]|nr:aldo/keto reductase [Bacteroidaceae bacterium]
MEDKNTPKLNRRSFLRVMAGSAATATAGLTLAGCGNKAETQASTQEPPLDQMTYRTNPNTGDRVSILGYGMMRLPLEGGKGSARESDAPIDQEMVNRLVDYAIDHGVNYFDTSPAYCRGLSEHSTGIALSRHPRDKYFIATKFSNFSPQTWSREESIKMYENSFKELQVDYIDYYLLHGIGMGEDGMEAYKGRYEKNGLLSFLKEEKKKGKIRNLGFSYHGDIAVYDLLLAMHDQEPIWDFVQIELNYLDWQHASEINPRNTDAEYLYNELVRRGIPAVIMEPLLGGRLSNMPDGIVKRLKERAPEKSVASWAFRYAATPPGVLTLLSGMTFMEHLKDNLLNLAPLVPLKEEEQQFLENIATEMVRLKTIPCNDCKYCRPCPYGIDIPGVFLHYNKCLSEGNVPLAPSASDYQKARRAFLVGYDRSVPKLRQANHCTGCGQCNPHCPQRILIPAEIQRIDRYVEELKQQKKHED